MVALMSDTRNRVRQFCVILVAAGCASGASAPTAPDVPPPPAVVRAAGAVWRPFFEGTMSATVTNAGGAGTWRWVAWEDLSDCNETPGCARRLAVQCEGASTAVGANGTAPLTVSCQTAEGFRWVVIETAVGAGWVRTACLPRPGNTCPAQLAPER